MTREEAIRVLYVYRAVNLVDESHREAFDTAIKALEQTSWIPVSEGLPKESGDYWCTFGGTNLTGSDHYTTKSDAKELFDDSEEYAGWRSQNVVAWMPLPESYKERSDKA